MRKYLPALRALAVLARKGGHGESQDILSFIGEWEAVGLPACPQNRSEFETIRKFPANKTSQHEAHACMTKQSRTWLY